MAVTDVPGQYAYEDTTQGDRLARRQMEALDAQREQHQGTGPWRSAAPGTCLTLLDHAVHSRQDEARDHFAVLAVVHQARNNLRAYVQAGLDSLLGSIRRGQQVAVPGRSLANASDEPIYTCTVTAQRAAVPARPCGFSSAGSGGLRAGWAQPLPDPRLTPRLSIHGVQTALVVGLDAPVHTDRDHRVEVQCH